MSDDERITEIEKKIEEIKDYQKKLEKATKKSFDDVGVSKVLEDELNKINIPFHVQPQPQARLSEKDIEKTFEKYYELCNI